MESRPLMASLSSADFVPEPLLFNWYEVRAHTDEINGRGVIYTVGVTSKDRWDREVLRGGSASNAASLAQASVFVAHQKGILPSQSFYVFCSPDSPEYKDFCSVAPQAFEAVWKLVSATSGGEPEFIGQEVGS